MIELSALALLAVVVAAGMAALMLVLFVFKALLWLVLLPLRLIVYIILLPLILLKLVLGGLLFIIVGPVLLVAGIVAAFALAAAIAVPLLPLVAIGLIVYLLVKASSTPAMTQS